MSSTVYPRLQNVKKKKENFSKIQLFEQFMKDSHLFRNAKNLQINLLKFIFQV